MKRWRSMRSLWRSLWKRGQAEDGLNDEVESYVELLSAEKVAAGLPVAEARRAALLEAGGIDQVVEEVRDVRVGARIERVLRDAKYALRGLRRDPLFTSAAILALALGIGVTTAIFSLVHGVLMRPLPYPESHELQRIWLNNPSQGIEKDYTSYPNFLAWRERSRAFENIVAVRGLTLNLTGAGDPEELQGEVVTEGYFEMFGVRPAVGTTFSPEQASPDGARVVVLSHELWSTRFASDRSLVGRTIQLNGESVPVVGVMPPGFGTAKFWVPLQFTAQSDLREAWGALWLPIFGRLRAGATLPQAQAEMSRLARDLAAEQPAALEGTGVLLEPLQTSMVGDVRTPLLLLLLAVTLVLLIACANIANLLLARGANRRGEFSVRVALGAGRAALVRQVLVESVVLGLLGGALGTFLAWFGVKALIVIAAGSLPRLGSVRLDLLVLGFSLAASLLASLLFGAAPAVDLARHKVSELLRGSGRSAVRGAAGVRPALMAAQFALALVLLYSAGLLLRSFANLLNVERGFDASNVLVVDLNLPGQRYADGEAVRQFYEQLLPQLRTSPGIQSADVISKLLLSRLPNSAAISIEGKTLSEVDANLPVAYDAITEGLPATLRMRLLSGRQFNAADGPNAPAVALVNQAFVKRFLPDAEPVGRRFTFGEPEGDSTRWIQIVGVLRDATRAGLDGPVPPYALLPFAQGPPSRVQLVVRTAADPIAMVPVIRGQLRRIDPQQPIANVRTLDQELAVSLAPRRIVLLLLTMFAAAAVVLAAIGIYGVISYMVNRRTREFGLRMALGAQPREVLLLVMRQASRPIAIGLVFGTLGSFGAARLLRTQLFGVSGFDVLTQGAVVAALALVAVLAAALPALRATGTDPLIALRAE
jgi:putative ABC transport system permease protein